jgi:SAM-dependent methyltransferase
MTKGIEGYKRCIQLFIETSQALDFSIVCKDFIDFLPSPPANVLDLGSGAGQNAIALAAIGFDVTAVEPMSAFLEASEKVFTQRSIQWLKGSLPHLACLPQKHKQFDFILIDAVWHHLDEWEREQAILRLSALIKMGGRCAISLRNGPAGLGTRVFATDVDFTIKQFEKCGFECLLSTKNQASILANKENVKWARLVLQKR